jgi:hypothetical protein
MTKDGYWDDATLKRKILKHIENETFVLTRHAAEEQRNDAIDLQDTLYVLKTGRHEREKTGFNNKFQIWKYAIRGKAENSATIRVVVSFPIEKMMSLSAMSGKKDAQRFRDDFCDEWSK